MRGPKAGYLLFINMCKTRVQHFSCLRHFGVTCGDIPLAGVACAEGARTAHVRYGKTGARVLDEVQWARPLSTAATTALERSRLHGSGSLSSDGKE